MAELSRTLSDRGPEALSDVSEHAEEAGSWPTRTNDDLTSCRRQILEVLAQRLIGLDVWTRARGIDEVSVHLSRAVAALDKLMTEPTNAR